MKYSYDHTSLSSFAVIHINHCLYSDCLFSYTRVEIPHEVTVYTGDVRGAGTNANVFLVMYGENGKSDQFDLRNKSDNFERAQVDKFKVSYYGGRSEFA